jgi:hypothetical protein
MNDKNKQDRLYEYGKAILDAKLEAGAKGLLWHFAYTYNWTENRRSFWSEERICAHTSMAPSTFQKRKKYLESLGWIHIIKTDLKKPPLIKPTIGVDDPSYEEMHWAKWHKSNVSELTLEQLSKLPDFELEKLAVYDTSELDQDGNEIDFSESRKEGNIGLIDDLW